ncbi:MAG: hypothetical protein COU07_00625 [Candidatus Harrisonbacteria bacterium CG10_big_fil_rev_8_21_14_0_10_40_38]|uniref:Uncharacterized protein n=1 Tax=Candidatus Harrisonbacteria bacterium CG10_big_fil_rev_8_21_14_0_10_40_38 TaxID=1974583 RepID=A0A2H0USJ4_9BACT|nr:MAG: hypothetical protein COU07_00625 [Candidatus Harrisonbacteria bacterium CG10_big_fil_rev_8_21_14_0_10_40_38]
MFKIKKETVVVTTSALLTVVAAMHLLRIIFNVDIKINGTSLMIWPSYVAVLALGFLAVLNLESIERRNKTTWIKFIMWLFVLDAIGVFYSWMSNLSYWGISRNGFGVITLFDVLIVIILATSIRKANR